MKDLDRRSGRASWLRVAAVALLAAPAAFWVGRLTAGTAPRSEAARVVSGDCAPAAELAGATRPSVPELMGKAMEVAALGAVPARQDPPPQDRAGAPTSGPSPAPAALSTTPALSPERVADVERESAARLAAMTPTFQTRCPSSRGGEFTVQISFDAEGREVGRALSVDKEGSAQRGALECLRDLDGVALTVRPPGAPIGVAVPLDLR